MPLPRALEDLTVPSPNFVACSVPNHMDSNFDNQRRRNQTYWVLFVSAKQGMYSLKMSCTAALPKQYGELEMVASFTRQAEVLAAWRTHCYHRHGKCGEHSHACYAGECPAHPPEIDLSTAAPAKQKRGCASVKREGSAVIKREGSAVVKRGGSAVVKREGSVALRSTRVLGTPPLYTSLPSSETDAEDVLTLPLFLPDSEEEEEVRTALSPGQGSRQCPTPLFQPRRRHHAREH
ncbi:hypothetical protein B0H19DRAFT_77409 [Mycena capillaripes]|nr:hypothetical protein B0H19DRAFT_77409 [Mycena capillaripes]